MPKKHKRINPKKIPREKGRLFTDHSSDGTPPESKKPAFSLEKLVSDKRFSLAGCDKDQKAALIDQMFKLSQLTWRDLKFSHRHGPGYEKIARTSLNAEIPETIPEDANIIAFRFHGKAPMVGYRDGRTRSIFYIVWLDRNFRLYDHG